MEQEANWQIYRTGDEGELVPSGTTGTLSAAARRIIEMEAAGAEGITFQIHVDTCFRTDQQAFDHLEYKGKHAFYVVRRVAAE